MSLRRLWLTIHRWLALSLGVVLAFVALLGAALSVAKPLDRWSNPELFQAVSKAAPSGHQLENARQVIVRELGMQAAITFRPPRQAGESLWAIVRGPWDGTIYIDPATGQELGRRGQRDGLYNLMFDLHSTLLMEDTGKAVLATLALAYLALLVSGLALWWPARWAHAWRVELRRGARRALFDLHRVGGSLLGLLVSVSVVTGAYMAWRPLMGAVNAVAGAQTLRPPAVPPSAGSRNALDVAVRNAQALFPTSKVGYVQVTADDRRPLRVRLKLDNDPHPNGLTSVWLHPIGGEVLRVDRWDALDPGTRAYTVIYPLHTGELGGLAHTVLNVMLGLVLVGFAASGLWLWWQRRSARVAGELLNGRSA